jgi:beta-alanine--pyruvate transaminase
LEEELQTIKGSPYVIDIRNYGLLGGVELEPIEGKPTARAMSVFRQCFDNGLLVRTTGDTIALCPPLIASEDEIRTVIAMLKASLSSIA